MNLSTNFTLQEFCRSETAVRRNIPNNLPVDLLANAKKTAQMLQRIRVFLSKQAGRDVPMRITSGYRCIVLNRAIGSSDTSDHVQALAADWEAPTFGSPTDICLALQPMVGALEIGQLINEFPDRDGWVHTSVRMPSKMINRVITITGRGVSVGILKA
jgi:hypothetical protein